MLRLGPPERERRSASVNNLADEPVRISRDVADALATGIPVVALESTVIAHGLPRPINLEAALEFEAIVKEGGARPATVGVVEGVPCVGLSRSELERIATASNVAKLSTRDLAPAAATRTTGATTVAATAFLAGRAGVQVFATGGIGGVHRGIPLDVSADLVELQRSRIVVVCAGAKSILDLPATREALEALGVLVLGWQTRYFPGFYFRETNLEVDAEVENGRAVADIWREHRALAAPGAILVCAPVPSEAEIPQDHVEAALDEATRRAARHGVRGKAITPFLLNALNEATGGETLQTNLALLRNNVRVAAEIAREIATVSRRDR